ncbi:thioredoxin domain-containing protein [Streptomyces sp. H10-C2]|uniref:thioredoxin domain-containing protein n=1 Tax=unclassified Streptomyces TaxID=2593676 RepID=UPI0024BBDE47|nr:MULTISPECIES: thioredoxin domain-containing protein [unclassified Streptomyces]MDJ0341066.1 thioredoxin domain-containing protein [Streptomyces sp. PH10-H1]MDJ0369583.1 thioredoxin domain-containing protein [Streptomyces sp. H10-C2]
MSSRNSQANKQAARERLRAEREKHAKKARLKRQFLVGGAVIAAIAIAGGAAVAVNQMNKPGEWEAAAKKALVKPANTAGTDGTVVVIGDPKNKHNLDAYEDMRCPVCASFEQESGAAVLKGATDGKYKISYTMGTFLDGNGGTGSKNALSALGAALNVSTDAFIQYHTLLYSKDVHPAETKDDFGSDDKLIELAQKVTALKGNKTFEDAVKNGTYDKWALTMSSKFNAAKDVTGTPTVKLDGKAIEVINKPSATVVAAIDKAISGK